MLMHLLVLGSVLCAACLSPGHVQCEDGRTCPAGMTCDDDRDLCLTRAQTTACAGITDGDVCIADGKKGICDRSLCEPGCGDDLTDPTEQCDDGNFASHDGCSSRCEVEVPTWLRVQSPWRGLTRHAAAYHVALGRTVVVGGDTHDGVSDRIWQHDPAKPTEPEQGWRDVTDAFGAVRPAARIGAAMAYDPVRDVLVLYGGTASVNTGNASEYFTETWEYAVSTDMFDGELVGRWTQVQTGSTPGPVFGAQMVYDENLDKIVILGGNTPTFTVSQMWTYDSGVWTEIGPGGTTARRRAAIAFDATRARLIQVGGHSVDDSVREFDGNSWTTIPVSSGPGPRSSSSLAYDPSRGTVVLYGGTLGITPDPAADTWEWDGATWELISGPRAPPARRQATLVAEPGALLLVGGQVLEGEPFDDAWQLAAGAWSDRTPRFGPGAAAAACGAYSPTARGVLVVGGAGANANSAALSETWLFDGNRWRHSADLGEPRWGGGTVYDTANDRFISFAGANNDMVLGTTWALAGDATGTWSQLPATLAARVDVGTVYDATLSRVVAVSGNDVEYRLIKGTLVFDGTTWSALPAATEPAATYRPATAYDPDRGVTVVFDARGDTWQLEGDTWTPIILASPSTPAPREQAGFIYDRFRKRFLLAGGTGPGLGGALDDVWELDPASMTWSRLFVSGSTPMPRVDPLVFTYHENARALLLHGGRGSTNITQGETWLLKFMSTTLDEDCSDGMDTDGDAQDDTEDPDCDPLPP